MIAQVCGFSYWSWLSGMHLGMWSWQQSKGRCELSTCDFWGTHEWAQGWTPQVCHSQRPTGWPPAEVLKQTAGNTLLQSPFMLSASFPFLSLPQAQSFILRNLGVGREKQVSPAATCTPGTAWNSLTTFAFCLLHGKGPHWHSQKPSHLQCCPGEGFPSWQIPSSFLHPNSSLSCSYGMPDSPLRKAGPPQTFSQVATGIHPVLYPPDFLSVIKVSEGRAGSSSHPHSPYWGPVCPYSEACVGRNLPGILV